MYTIKQAARLTGVPEASLRAWERRYGVVVPQRNDSGYRVYDERALASVTTMRHLVEGGWSPSEAAHALLAGTAPQARDDLPGEQRPAGPSEPTAAIYSYLFLTAATHLDTAGLEESLDGGFALGSFEYVMDTWLFPTLQSLGARWGRGEINVAGEHLASNAVHRRLAAAFEAAGSRSRGPTVLVGLPSGSQHELGALAFATAARRRGMDVLYLGANVPVSSWESAATDRRADAAVLGVVTPADRVAAFEVAARLARLDPAPIVCSGGAHGADLGPGVQSLTQSISAAARELDRLTHGLGHGHARIRPAPVGPGA